MSDSHGVNWRERIQAVLDGQIPDRIPAIFRLDKWYKARAHAHDLPGELAGLPLTEVEARLGLAQSARQGYVFKTALRPPVERIESRHGDSVITEWRTPRRTLRRVRRYGPGDEVAGIDATTIEFPVKCPEDYAAYVEVIRHTEFLPAYEEYLQYDRMVGCAGLPLVILGPIPVHDLMLKWTGYERGYLDLCDHPDVVLPAVEEANAVYRRMWSIAAESPATFLMHGVNFDTQMTSPRVFREHFLPYIKVFNREMHLAGKKVAFHADGDMSELLELALEADYDAADCFASHPMVRCTVARARAVWQDRITIWGGIPSILLERHSPLDRLRGCLEDLYHHVAPGDHFMPAISDAAMPTSSWEHLAFLCRWLRDHSKCPIETPRACEGR